MARGKRDADPEIPLTDVLRSLRQEMLAAIEAGRGKGLRFEVEDVEVEMQVVVTKGVAGEVEGSGGLKFWVLDAAAKGKAAAKYDTSRIQRVKLRLRPKLDKNGKSKTVDLAG